MNSTEKKGITILLQLGLLRLCSW